MTLHIIYDSSHRPSPTVTTLLGIPDFRDLVYRRRPLLYPLEQAISAAGLPPAIEISSAEGWRAYAAGLETPLHAQDQFLICPAHIATSASNEQLARFLRKTALAPANFRVPTVNGAPAGGWLLLGIDRVRDFAIAAADGTLDDFLANRLDGVMLVLDQLILIDLNHEAALLDFLAGAFDARFFNALVSDRYTVTKSSSDRAKLDREYRFARMLPDEMRMFFIEPFGFVDDGERASYSMERLLVPDMAIQWIHQGHKSEEFALFLDRVFHFIGARASRPASREEVAAQVDALFMTKVEERIVQLKALPEYRTLAPLLDGATGGLDALFEQYRRLFARHRQRLLSDALVIGHGDLCFSNVLYSKTSQLLKLIDPRGAAQPEDLFVHPYYDLAKLSHSVLGSYDLINHDMFDITIDEELRPTLALDRAPPARLQQMFVDAAAAAGFDPFMMRLCEVSLFVSMLPLHIDRPRKVLGFAINAANILRDLDARPR